MVLFNYEPINAEPESYPKNQLTAEVKKIGWSELRNNSNYVEFQITLL